MSSVNNNNWFSQGVNSVIGSAPTAGSQTPQYLEIQLQVVQLITQFDLIANSVPPDPNESAKLQAIYSQLTTMYNTDPNIQQELGSDLYNMVFGSGGASLYVFQGLIIQGGAIKGPAYRAQLNSDLSVITTWMNNSASQFQALVHNPDPNSPFSQQQMDDIRNLALTIMDLNQLPNAQYGQGFDGFFKNYTDIPQMLVAYYYQENINNGESPTDALNNAIASVKSDMASYPATSPNIGPSYYDEMMGYLKTLVNNPSGHFDPTYVWGDFSQMATDETPY